MTAKLTCCGPTKGKVPTKGKFPTKGQSPFWIIGPKTDLNSLHKFETGLNIIIAIVQTFPSVGICCMLLR